MHLGVIGGQAMWIDTVWFALEIPVNEMSVYVMEMYLVIEFKIVCFLHRKVVFIY